MKSTHYSRKTRQLQNLVSQVNKLMHSEAQVAKESLRLLLAKIHRLAQEIGRHIGAARLKHILGATAVFFGVNASAQSFETPFENPFNLKSTSYLAAPTAVDLDADGDLDLMVAEYYGAFQYFKNVGTKKNALYALPTKNPFGISPPESFIASTTFADIDNDGDLDMLAGGYYGTLNFFENTGTATSPAFAAVVENPFGLDSAYYIAMPAFVDLDDDGDFDLLVGEYYGSFKYYKNIGTKSNPQFETAVYNPFGLASTNSDYNAPTLADLDGDGDLDILSGVYYGALVYYKNIGTKSNPSFESPVENPFNLTNTYYFAMPTFMDIDDDGDFDVLVGEAYGKMQFFRNTEKVSSIDDGSVATFIKLYPNPAADVLHIDIPLTASSVTINDMQGRQIISVNTQNNQVDISALECGTYLIEVLDKDGLRRSSMFIKE